MMGAVKHAVLEVEDFIAGSLNEGRTLNQTIRDAQEAFKKLNNVYLLNGDLIEDKYYSMLLKFKEQE